MFIPCLLILILVNLACPQGESKEVYWKRSFKPREYYQERIYDTYGRNPRDSCSIPKVVDQFRKHFTDEVKKCKLLTSIFNGAYEVTREEFKAALFYIASVVAEQTGFGQPTEKALKTIEGIVPSCQSPTPELLMSILSVTIGKRLNDDGKLFSQNVQVLAQSYAHFTKDVAEAVAGDNCPRSKIQAVITGFPTFMGSQDLYVPDNLLEAARVFSNEWRCQDKNATATKNCPIACYSPEKPTLKVCNNVCKIKSKAIDIFVSAFSQQVKKCKTLSNLFNVAPSVTSAMFSRGTYYLALHYNGQYRVEKPRDLADFQSRFIKDVQNLKPNIVERVHLQFLGKHLLSEEILNCQNAEKLAEMYADIAKKKAELIVDSRDDRSKVVAIQSSWRRFLYFLDAISRDKYPKISYLYGNEWRCQE